MLGVAIDLAVLAILARVWFVYGQNKGRAEGQAKVAVKYRTGFKDGSVISYEIGWQDGYEAAEEKEDEAVVGFDTTYDWRNNAPERGRREKADAATH